VLSFLAIAETPPRRGFTICFKSRFYPSRRASPPTALLVGCPPPQKKELVLPASNRSPSAAPEGVPVNATRQPAASIEEPFTPSLALVRNFSHEPRFGTYSHAPRVSCFFAKGTPFYARMNRLSPSTTMVGAVFTRRSPCIQVKVGLV